MGSKNSFLITIEEIDSLCYFIPTRIHLSPPLFLWSINKNNNTFAVIGFDSLCMWDASIRTRPIIFYINSSYPSGEPHLASKRNLWHSLLQLIELVKRKAEDSGATTRNLETAGQKLSLEWQVDKGILRRAKFIDPKILLLAA